MSEQNDKNCPCISEGFYITKRQTSIVCSLLIIFFLLTFVSGYFWGHGKATEEFTEKLVDDSFTDKINYSFYSNFEKNLPESSDNEEEDFEEVESANSNDTQRLEKNKDENTPNNEAKKLYYAELIGFGSLKAAKQFADRLSDKNYNVDIRQRVSKTSKGKTIYWFQAVTEKFENKSQLLELVDKIQKNEKIKGVKIVEEDKE